MDAPSQKNISRANPSRLFSKGIHFLYARLLKPRSADEDDKRKELLLNSILCGMLALVGLLDLTVLYNTLALGKAYVGVPFRYFTAFLLLLAALLYLSRKGFRAASSYAIIGLSLLGTMYSSYLWGLNLPTILLGNAFIILMATMLISIRFGLSVFSFIAVALLALAYGEQERLHLTYWHGRSAHLVDALQYVVILAFITTVSFIYGKDIEKSLGRARDSEYKLRLERDLLEIRVEERTAELRQAQMERTSQLNHFAEFGRLSSGLFHDLAGPLSTVAANVERLSTALHPDLPAIKDHIRLSLNASKKMERFMTAIRKQVQLNDLKESFEINSAIEDVIMLFNYRTTTERVIVEFSSPERMFTYNNPLKFHQIISNLMSNALDALSKRLDRKEISVSARRDKGMAVVEIKDNGAGIPETCLDKIFAPFFTTKASGGIGLGLANCKAAVEKDFHGSISVQSREGHGSTFVVEFPITEVPASSGPAA